MKTAKANIKRVKISDLKAHPKNAKNHDKDGIRQSIREYGYAETITVDENGVILAGHGRVEQLSAEGYTEVDAFVKEGLTEKQKEEYILKANKLVERGGWDKEKLKLFDEDVLENALFSSSEIDKIFAGTEDDEDPFNVDEEYKAIKKPSVKLGEIYQLGNHRLMCGSATSEDDMKKLMGDDKADCIFSDPPYNMNYKSQKHGGIIGDNQGVEEFETFSLKFIQLMDVHARPGATFYICSGYNSYPVFLYALAENGFQFATPIVWVKNTIGMGLQDYRPKHELVIKTRRVKKNKKAEMVLYGWKEGKRYFTESRSEADVWEFKKRAGTTMVHPTQKPLALIHKAIENSTERGGLVLDPFLGSGSTLISAEMKGRRCNGTELDPKYAECVIKRWEALTGLKAKLVA